jgi:hypothetical protein
VRRFNSGCKKHDRIRKDDSQIPRTSSLAVFQYFDACHEFKKMPTYDHIPAMVAVFFTLRLLNLYGGA